jgi:hypothetical protein
MLGLEEGSYRDLARVLREWAAARAPNWTDANDADPGITLLELLAFVTESIEATGDTMSERGRLAAARLARSALALAGRNGPAQDSALARNRYFSGRLLGAQDFQLEQDYFRERQRRHNRALHGAGVVHGLQVAVRPNGGSGEQVVVQAGFAIAPDGEEIEVRCEASARLPHTGSRLFVMLSRAEFPSHPVPASADGQLQFTRVEETFSLGVQATASQNGIALARLIGTASGWTIDDAFAVPRARCHQE